MARPDPATALRLPSRRRRDRDQGDGTEGDRPRLRLVVTRGKLAVELASPCALGPLRIDALSVSLPDVAFPVELSGGDNAFRHRRGRLEKLTLSITEA